MIDHVTLLVSDYAKSREFYRKALAPLGYAIVMEFDRRSVPQLEAEAMCGLGERNKPDLWLRASKTVAPSHIALAARDRAAVDAFYEAAMSAGARDNGSPGVRAQYHPNYYAAFVLDPDGYNLEVVCHHG